VFFRAILEMAAMLAFGDFERIRNGTGLWPSSMSFSGGAASNELLAQILSDVMESKVTVFDSSECSALGGVMIASAASGIYDSLESSVKSMSKIKTEYLPSVEVNQVYKAKYRRWRSIYDSLLRLSDDGLTKYLWIAAGARKYT
jgi:sugar (pentulose or hexulose) kinase